MFQKIGEYSYQILIIKNNAKYEGNGEIEKLSALSGINQVDNFSRIGDGFTTFLFRTTDPIVV